MISLDYSLDSPQDRVACCDRQIQALGRSPTRSEMTAMADYVLFVADARSTGREKAQEYPIVTRNRSVTISKREVSAETLVVTGSSEDALSAMELALSSDSVMPLDRKMPDDEDADDDRLEQNASAIASLEGQMANATGRRRFDLKRQVISKYQERHVIRESMVQRTPGVTRSLVQAAPSISIDEDVWLDPDTLLPTSDSPLSLYDESTVARLLQDYEGLVQASAQDFQSDVTFLLMDLDDAVEEAFADDPFVREFVEMKKAHVPNSEVARMMLERHGIDCSVQYYSNLWSVRVPREVARCACKRWLVRHYVDPVAGKWKVCSRCGRRLLAHPMFFSRNTSRDGYYSMCKECRHERRREELVASGVASGASNE